MGSTTSVLGLSRSTRQKRLTYEELSELRALMTLIDFDALMHDDDHTMAVEEIIEAVEKKLESNPDLVVSEQLMSLIEKQFKKVLSGGNSEYKVRQCIVDKTLEGHDARISCITQLHDGRICSGSI